ncbi:double-stranded RNA-binding protein 4 isoform X1 [Triticum aestivum]|uniref:double-stranded RNA-binding protein 4 isoform X1 n=1 Tax=Triticum aestivum TaxID=4565 RepID=UPI00084501F0|nr:double-stranded RNA-binding protein 4-like isoform X1 [Triticum aestivum]
MATTAAAAAPVPGAIPAAAPAAPSAQPHPVPDKCTNYKNHLQEWTQRNDQKLPAYNTESKRDHHRLEFRSTVEVGGERFQSARNHSRRKDAEQDAARVAYEILVTKTVNDDDHTDALGLIDQGVVFCKSILHEFAVKTKVDQPTYSADHPEGVSPMTLFVSSVLFAGNTYTGEAATCKKDAEQKAARVAVKSILATKNTCMHQIVRSKKELIIAITSSGFNKERGVVSQENCNAPTNAITPIKFVPAGEAAGLTGEIWIFATFNKWLLKIATFKIGFVRLPLSSSTP